MAFRRGDAHALAFATGSLDFIVCRAAFKNVSDPVTAKCGPRSSPTPARLIIDMRNDVSDATNDEFVRCRGGGRPSALIVGWTFKHMLRQRAYNRTAMLAMATAAGFKDRDIAEASIGMDVWLRPRP